MQQPSLCCNAANHHFAEIVSVHKYQTRLASLQKYYLPRMKTSLGQLSLKYIGSKIWSNIPEKLKLSSPYSFGKKYKKVLLSCQTSCWSSFYRLCLPHSVWSSFYILVTFCNIALMPLFSLLSTSIEYSCLSHPLYIDLGQLSRQLLQPAVGSNTDVGEMQTRYQSVATLNGLNQY